MKNKFLYLNDYETTNNFDIIALCETQLGHADYGDTCINGLLHSDYNILRADRAEGHRGGGVALVYKQCLKIKIIERKTSTQFECIIPPIMIKKIILLLLTSFISEIKLFLFFLFLYAHSRAIVRHSTS